MIHAPSQSFTVNGTDYTVIRNEKTAKLLTVTIAIDSKGSRHVWNEDEYFEMYNRRKIN